MRREAGYKRAVLGTTILSNGKGHFGPTDQKETAISGILGSMESAHSVRSS